MRTAAQLPDGDGVRSAAALRACTDIASATPRRLLGAISEHRLAQLLEIYADERAAEARPEEQLLAVYTGCGGEVAC